MGIINTFLFVLLMSGKQGTLSSPPPGIRYVFDKKAEACLQGRLQGKRFSDTAAYFCVLYAEPKGYTLTLSEYNPRDTTDSKLPYIQSSGRYVRVGDHKLSLVLDTDFSLGTTTSDGWRVRKLLLIQDYTFTLLLDHQGNLIECDYLGEHPILKKKP